MKDKRSVLSLDEIRCAALAMREKIKALKVTYQFEQLPTDAEKHMAGFTPPRHQKRVFAMRGPLWSATLKGTEGGKAVDSQCVVDGTHVACRSGDTYQSATIVRMDHSSSKSLTGHWRPYCQMVNISYRNDIMNGWNFPETLSLEHFPFHVRETQEKVGDRWCHVIEHPHNASKTIAGIGDGEPVETIWVDSNNPAIMVKRERSFTSRGKFYPWSRTSLGAYKEFNDGIWLPLQIEGQSFDVPAHNVEQLLGVPISNATCKVEEIKLNNEVTAEDFDFVLAKGESLCFYSKEPVSNEGIPTHMILKKIDNTRHIAMPLDQSSNESIKSSILEKDATFFRS